jgi:hypothetical protein
MKIRAGTRGRIVNVDGSRAAALFVGAQARVISRMYYPDGVIVELLDDGPVWRRGTIGEVALRYFVPDPPRRLARVAKRAV